MVDAWPTEASVKAISVLLATVGTIIAVIRYLDDRRTVHQIARLEARKPFNQKQQEIYLALVDATAVISCRYGKDDWETAFDKFWIMYWGVVPIVADENVSRAIDRFADTLDHLADGVSMRNASMDVARACRQSLGQSWSADFQPYEKSQHAGVR